MDKKDFYDVEELEKDISEIKEDLELLKGYDELLGKVKQLKEDKR